MSSAGPPGEPAPNETSEDQTAAARLRLMSDELPAAVWTVDQDLRITSASGSAFSRLGLDTRNYVGQTLAAFAAASQQGSAPLERHRRALAGEVLRHRTELMGRSFDVRLEPLRGPDGAIRGAIGVALDVTERLQAEEQGAKATELAHAVIANAGQGIVAYDRNLRYVLWNPFMERYTGHSAAVALGRRPDELFPELEAQGVIRLLERALQGEVGRSEDLRFEYADTGHEGFASATYTPRHDAHGQIDGVIAIITDVSERHRAAAALAASEQRYRLLFERNLAGFCRTTVEGRILECNDAFAHLLGYRDRQEVLRHSAWELYFERAERTAFVATSLRERTLTGRELRLRRKDGTGVWVLVNETVIEEGDPPQVVFETTLVDISGRKQAEAEALRLAEMKSNFMVVASHEMRTPLTILIGNVGLLRLAPLTAMQEDAVKRCERTLANLNHALGDILTMLQLEQGRTPLRSATTDVAELAASVLEELRPFGERRQQHLELQVAGALPPVVLDAARMRVALGDLLQNAIKFTPDGGAIRLLVGVDDPWLHVQVQDDGIGIEPGQLEHVFSHFYTAADPRFHRSGTFEFQARGAGLGLAIVRGYAEAHGGRVWAESPGLGQGSTFHLLLPLAR